MSIDERLREELRASTTHLEPDLDTELAGLLSRARRRRRWRVAGALAVAASVAAVGVWSAGALTEPDAVGPAHEGTSKAVNLYTRPAGEALDTGTYTMWFTGTARRDGKLAEFDLPAGFTFDGWNVAAGSGRQLRTLSFWTIAQVSHDFCRMVQHWVDVGDTAEELADAFAEMPFFTTTAPVPAELGGVPALYQEATTPTTFAGCPHGQRYGFIRSVRSDNGTISREYAGVTYHQWIVDLEDRVYVVTTAYNSGATPEQIHQLDEIARSVTFVDAPD